MPDSFFELVTRYSQRLSHDPGENRLTAVLVAVLQQRPGLARALFERLLPITLTTDPSVETQTTVRLADGRHAFLDIEVTTPGPRPVAIWVEVKRTSGESGEDQFAKYAATLQKRPGVRALLVLGPRRKRLNLGGLPAAANWDPRATVRAHWISWEDVYLALAELSGRTPDAWERWSLDELLRFLETEGFRPMALRPAHAEALTNVDEAWEALAGVIEEVDDEVSGTWRRLDRTDRRSDHYVQLDYAPERGGGWSSDSTLAWGVEGGQLFAGVATAADSGPSRRMRRELIDSWRASFDKTDWKHEEGHDYWIWKTLSLARLAELETTDEQVALVVRFVLEVFADITRHDRQ